MDEQIAELIAAVEALREEIAELKESVSNLSLPGGSYGIISPDED